MRKLRENVGARTYNQPRHNFIDDAHKVFSRDAVEVSAERKDASDASDPSPIVNFQRD